MLVLELAVMVFIFFSRLMQQIAYVFAIIIPAMANKAHNRKEVEARAEENEWVKEWGRVK